jgi:hypothetical protein
MRRHVEIFRDFAQKTGHAHPHMEAACQNYRNLLTAMKLPEDEIERRVREVTWLGPRPPVVVPAQPRSFRRRRPRAERIGHEKSQKGTKRKKDFLI